MPQPPLLCEEGNIPHSTFLQFIHTPYDRAYNGTCETDLFCRPTGPKRTMESFVTRKTFSPRSRSRSGDCGTTGSQSVSIGEPPGSKRFPDRGSLRRKICYASGRL